MEGEVYSWGEGDDGKLGHGGKGSCDRPRVVEALRGRDVVGISCGGAHSAAITATGALCLLLMCALSCVTHTFTSIEGRDLSQLYLLRF